MFGNFVSNTKNSFSSFMILLQQPFPERPTYVRPLGRHKDHHHMPPPLGVPTVQRGRGRTQGGKAESPTAEAKGTADGQGVGRQLLLDTEEGFPPEWVFKLDLERMTILRIF